LGYVDGVSELIKKAINLLEADSKAGKNSPEIYALAIEQSYVCMTDLFHFLSAGPSLSALTHSSLVTGSVSLVLSPQPYLSLRVFKKLAAFLHQLSLDNPEVGTLHSEPLD